jgi:hypothetical protein
MSNRTFIHGPHPAEVLALRLKVQDHYGIGIGDAQRMCASTVRSARGTWMQWEKGLRRMHPGLWELAQLRCGTHEALAIVTRTSKHT